MAASDTKKKGKGAEGPPDPRMPLEPTPKALEATLAELEAVVAKLAVPSEPKPTDLVEAMLHISFAAGGPCGWGQAARTRIRTQFVDRNEFRLSEAFELEAMLADMPIPNLFERCEQVVQAVRQIYNEQNDVKLEFLREAQVSDRNAFLQRAVAIRPEVGKFLSNIISFEELLFSDKSTQRVQQRLNLDAKQSHVEQFIAKAAVLLKPFGGLPLDVGPEPKAHEFHSEPVLSPACLLLRFAPSGKR